MGKSRQLEEMRQRRMSQMLDELQAGGVYMKMRWGRGGALVETQAERAFATLQGDPVLWNS